MAIAYVNTGTGNNDTTATSQATAATSHTAGNLLVVFIGLSSATVTVTSVTDTAGNLYTQAVGAFQRTGSNDVTDLWYAFNIKGNASNVVTATYSATAPFSRLIVNQYSGCSKNPNVFLAGTTGLTAAGTSMTSGAMLAKVENLLIASFMGASASETYTAGSGCTLRGSVIGTDTQSQDRIIATANSYTAQMTALTSARLVMSAAIFKAPSPYQNNYQGASVGDGMSTGEKIR